MSSPAIDPITDLLQRGLRAHQQGDTAQAQSLYHQVLQIQPDQADALHLLGVLAYQNQDLDQALVWLLAAVEQRPQVAIYHFNLAHAYVQLGQDPQAEAHYRQAIALDRDQALPYVYLARLYQRQHQLEAAVPLYQAALARGYETLQIHLDLAEILRILNQTEAARQHYLQAHRLDPEDVTLPIRAQTLLPLIYDSVDSIDHYRRQFYHGLEALRQLPLEDHQIATQIYDLFKTTQLNFHLAYQGQDDRALQENLGQSLSRVMEQLYPQWRQPRVLPEIRDRIRIGYLSSCFYRHTVGRLALGWIEEADRNRFEVICYHAGAHTDPLTTAFQQASDRFYCLRELESLSQQILGDQLHILVILDIGLRPITALVAALRLAPIQCTTWLHPITSGLPTVDYYLSSDLMEPPEAEAHYSETLVRLPHLAIRYPSPNFPQINQINLDRQRWGLGSEQVIYLCCQSLDKYLPQYDHLFPEIALRVPEAQFVFLGKGRAAVVDLFGDRLQRVFQQRGLESKAYCRILPRLVWEDYVALNQISDIFLDSLLWSGGNTTLEAIACDLPVVSCPGPLMRGRHTYAILQLLGITETLASDPQEYVEIAVRLGKDSSYRHDLVARIRYHKQRVFADRCGIEGLEQFYQQTILRLAGSSTG